MVSRADGGHRNPGAFDLAGECAIIASTDNRTVAYSGNLSEGGGSCGLGNVFVPTEETFPKTTDVVVVGGGIVGVASAFWLSRSGLDTVLVEMRDGLSTLTTPNSIECFRTQFTEPPMAELALRFILAETIVSSIIPGMRKIEHVESNIATSDTGPLDKDLLRKLEKHRWDREPTEWSQ